MFKQLVNKRASDAKKVSGKDIDCIYIMLSRGPSTPKNMNEAELADKVKGFDS